MSNDGATLVGKQLSIEGVDSVHGGMTITQAREALGLSLEELSAKLKVNVRKLDMIERGEFDKVTGGQAHVRGLIRAMCKAVGVEAEPILAQLPSSAQHSTSLDQLDTQFRAPFASSGRMGKLGVNTLPRAAAGASGSGKPLISNALIVGAMLAALAALLLYAWPAIQPAAERAYVAVSEKLASISPKPEIDTKKTSASQSQPDAKPMSTDMPPGMNTQVTIAPADASVLAALPSASAPVVAEAGPTVTAIAASAPAAGVPVDSDKLVIQATAPSWVEIRGINGNLLVSRSLSTGERLEQGIERRRSIVIGNAAGTQVWVRGKAFDVLAQASGNNVARFDIE
jgi:cytoskeleton protein RodZ